MRTGVCIETGKVLKGWEHCVQSIGIILRTRLGSLKWRRLFGSEVASIQDANAAASTLITLYRSVAEALDAHEPGFKLNSIELVAGGREGVFHFDLHGTFFPLGHLGVFDQPESRTASVRTAQNDNEFPGRVEVVA